MIARPLLTFAAILFGIQLAIAVWRDEADVFEHEVKFLIVIAAGLVVDAVEYLMSKDVKP